MLELLHQVLNAPAEEQQAFIQERFPAAAFQDPAHFRWVYSYQEQHGHLPTWRQLRQRFPQIPATLEVTENVAQLVNQVRDRLTFQAVSGVIDRARKLHEEGQPIAKVVSYLQTAVTTLPNGGSGPADVTLDTPVALQAYRNLVAKIKEGKFVPLTPWAGINECIGLTEVGDFLVLAARPNLGKSWLAVAFAEHFRRLGMRVLFASQEMSRERIALRWESLRFGLDYPALSRGCLPPSHLARWVASRRLMRAQARYDTLITGPSEVKGSGFGNILSKVATFRPDVLIVDGAYLIYPDQQTHSDRERFAVISATLKRISLAAKVRTIAVVQAKREAEPDVVAGTTTASLAHIYGSDTWSQDADFVLILNGKRWAPTRQITLEKAREGTQGSSTISFQLSPRPHFREIASSGIGGAEPSQVEVEVV